jgi:fimbrial chaperone protein
LNPVAIRTRLGRMTSYRSPTLWILLLFALLLPRTVAAAGWRVIPILLDFDQKTRSGVITLYNEGESKISLQIKSTAWTQDSAGKDLYLEDTELIFFPRLLTIEPGKSQVLRVGIQIPATAVEKTYRLFIEEIPEARKADQGATIAIALRFGVPIYAAPLKSEPRGEFAATTLNKGTIATVIKNTGNVHFRIQSVQLVGKDPSGVEVLRQKVDGWYLLSGVSRPYLFNLKPEECRKAATLELLADTDREDIATVIKVDPQACNP